MYWIESSMKEIAHPIRIVIADRRLNQASFGKLSVKKSPPAPVFIAFTNPRFGLIG
jgi:hypothetical protein